MRVLSDRELLSPAAFLILALTLGGAGSQYPLAGMLVQVAAVLLLARTVIQGKALIWRRGTRSALLLLGFVLLLPLLQLIPLPSEMWSALPGRALAAEIAVASGTAGNPRPLSLDPGATWEMFLGLLPGTAMLLAVIGLSSEDRLKLVQIFIGFAVLATLLGALQLASGSGEGVTPFPSGHIGHAVGLFSNRNHQATFLLLAIILTGAAARSIANQRQGGTARHLIVVGLLATLSLGIVATFSRMGLALLPLALLAAAALAFAGRVRGSILAMGAAVSAAITWFTMQHPLVVRVLDRFEDLDDARFSYWADTLWALPHYLPWGSGFGTFAPVFQAAEQLDTVAASIANQAHNEYLQLALEGGIAALLLLLAFLFLLARQTYRSFKDRLSQTDRSLRVAAAAAIIIVLLHSIVDYPTRMLGLGASFGMLCALLLPPPRKTAPGARHLEADDAAPARASSRFQLARKTVAAAAAAVLIAAICATGVAAHLITRGQYAAATRLAPWSAEAHENFAQQELAAGNLEGAATSARRALARSPMRAAALRTLGLVSLQRGELSRAANLMSLAGALGWRDTPTQLWLLQQAIATGDAEVAMQRADALLRRNRHSKELTAALRQLARDPRLVPALAQRLAEQPSWRSGYLTSLGSLSPEEADAHERLLRSLARTGSPPSRSEVRPLVALLVREGQHERAHRLWRQLGGGAEGLNDGEFDQAAEAFDTQGGPFEWSRPRLIGASVSFGLPDEPVNGTAAHIVSDGIAAGPVLRQLLMVPAGRYRLAAKVREVEPGSTSLFTWRVRCRDEEQAAPLGKPPAGLSRWTTSAMELHLPDCRPLELELVAEQGRGGPLGLWIDGVTLAPLSPPR